MFDWNKLWGWVCHWKIQGYLCDWAVSYLFKKRWWQKDFPKCCSNVRSVVTLNHCIQSIDTVILCCIVCNHMYISSKFLKVCAKFNQKSKMKFLHCKYTLYRSILIYFIFYFFLFIIMDTKIKNIRVFILIYCIHYFTL